LNPFHYGRIPGVEPLQEGRSRGRGQLERTARP